MKIKMYIKDGYVAFECQGVFLEPLQKIVLNRETGLLSVVLKWSGDEIGLECPVDINALQEIEGHDICGVGFYHHEEMLGASLVPFEQVH